MTTESDNASHAISTLNEKPLHAALKQWYARPGDRLEVPVDGFLVDIVRGDLLVEIQTQSFSALKRKLTKLVEEHRVRLVYPMARDKWIVKLRKRGKRPLGRRKSPKHAAVEHLFEELVSLPTLLANPNFSIEVLLIQEEEVRRHEAGRVWRRKGWVTHERRLLEVLEHRVFETPADLAGLLPSTLDEPFTTADLASAISQPRGLAQKMAYCLREIGTLDVVGKQGNALLYVRSPKV